jgi:2-hydroxychromene-2-carboxylate isomerase
VAAFSLAALRQAFAAGRDLAVTDNVLIAAASCELHPRAVLKGMESRAVTNDLQRARDQALSAGVTELPALALGTELFVGDAAAELACPPPAGEDKPVACG